MKTTILTLLLIPTLSFASIDTNLRLGMKGTEVTKLQTLLIEKGYDTQKTGYFGAKTLQAVKKYQKDNKLPSTGFVGLMTRGLMNTVPVQIATTTVSQSIPVVPVIPTATVQYVYVPQQEIVYIEQKVYNKAMEKPYTIGTPTTINKISTADEAYSYVELPITFTSEIVRSGNVATIEGTITNESGSQSAGNEFAFAPTSKVEQIMNLGNVSGTFQFTFTLKDSRGEVLYTTNESIQL